MMGYRSGMAVVAKRDRFLMSDSCSTLEQSISFRMTALQRELTVVKVRYRVAPLRRLTGNLAVHRALNEGQTLRPCTRGDEIVVRTVTPDPRKAVGEDSALQVLAKHPPDKSRRCMVVAPTGLCETVYRERGTRNGCYAGANTRQLLGYMELRGKMDLRVRNPKSVQAFSPTAPREETP